MEKVMMPFISVYHAVSRFLRIPGRILHYSRSGVLAITDKFSTNKNRRESNAESAIIQKEIDEMVSASNREEKKKDEPSFAFRYKAINSANKKVAGTMDGSTLDDVRDFLRREGYEVLEIAPRKKYDLDIKIGGKFGPSDLAFSLTQLSTYLKAGIPLIDSVRILEKQTEKAEHRKVYQKMVYELLKGENLSDAMERQDDKFPKLLINMVKTSELTGDLTTVLDDMAEYYTSKDETRKTMKSAMTYPVVVLSIAVVVVIFILTSIVPKFVDMYSANDAEIPALTTAIMDLSNFIVTKYWLLILIFGGIIGIFIALFKNIQGFRKSIQIFTMHIPVFGKIIIYNEVYNFTKTFSSLLNHGVFITDSMEILSRITTNEVYKDLINRTIINLNKGANISESFKGSWAFPVAAYEMIVTGESTGQLGLMMEKVASHYQSLHKNIVKQLQSLLEPFMIAILAVIVGIILLAVMMPMFDIYGKIQ